MRPEQCVVPDIILLPASARIGFRPGRQSRAGRFGDWCRCQKEPIRVYRIAIGGIGKQPTFLCLLLSLRVGGISGGSWGLGPLCQD